MRNAIAIVLFSLLHIAPAMAQTSMSLSLEEAQAFALENSFLMKNANLDFKERRWQTVEVLTEGLPNIYTQTSYRNNFNIAESIIPGDFVGQPGQDVEVQFGVKHNIAVDFALEQLIVDGRYFIGLKANKAILSVAQGQIDLTAIQLKEVVATTYYSVLVARENKALVDTNIATLKKILYETTELYNSGFAEELDVDRLQLNLSSLESRKRSADMQYELSLNVMKYQLGLTLDIELDLTDSLKALLVVPETIETGDFNYQDRLEYRLLATQTRLRGYEAASIKAGYYPSLYFNVGYGFNNQRGTFSELWSEKWFQSGYYGLQLNVPIFDSYKKGAQAQQIKMKQLRLQNDLANFQNQAELEVSQTSTNYSNALEEFKNQEKNLALAQKIYNKVNIMYREGVGSSLELAEAETSLNTTQIDYVNAIYNLLTKKVELQKALGEL